MSDLDDLTDTKVAEDLAKINIRLSRENRIYGYEDATMLQAVKRLQNNEGATEMDPESKEVFEKILLTLEEQNKVNRDLLERIKILERRFGKCILDDTPIYNRLDDITDDIRRIEQDVEELQK